MKNSVLWPLAFVASAGCGDNHYIVEGAHYQYVVSTIELPVSATDAIAFAIDLDGDSNPDNNLGQSLDLLKGFGFDIRSTVAEGVRNGGILMGLDLQTTDFFDADAQAVHRVGLQSTPMKKQKINITLDPDVVAWFKQQAGGRGYQTLINATLREAMQQKTIEETLRRVIREELHSA